MGGGLNAQRHTRTRTVQCSKFGSVIPATFMTLGRVHWELFPWVENSYLGGELLESLQPAAIFTALNQPAGISRANSHTIWIGRSLDAEAQRTVPRKR
jgi:hypothetical protein